ncbi:MAG TPA: ABC transporter permease [Candidatus Gastranaerophilales bacterium]|nr:ABC transporter permease [Candidatus Gastranaerophilales bacterium]
MHAIEKIIEIYNKTYTKKFLKTFYINIIDFFETLGFIGMNLYYSIICLFKGELDKQKFFEQAARFGVDSLPISLLMVSITGMIMAIQVSLEMVKQGAGDYVGMLVAISITRELGPIIGSFAVISLVGSSMAAEISTMKVTDQIDAMKVLRVNPINYLLAPRIFAGFFIMPFVIIIANFMGIIGGLIMSHMVAELNTLTYINSVWQGLTVKDIESSVVKAFVFGGLIALASSSIGYKAEGGAIDVGNATTKAVVWSFVMILLADYLISWLFFNQQTF